MKIWSHLDHITQIPINTKAHDRLSLKGFHVNIRGTITRCLAQQTVDHADNRSIVRGFQQIYGFWHILQQLAEIQGFAHFINYLSGILFCLRIKLIEFNKKRLALCQCPNDWAVNATDLL